MSIRHSLLALLQEQPRYGYQLRAEFESRTGSTWPLNVGQVYSTLARLERDGLVAPAGGGDDATSSAHGDSQVHYRITPDGSAEVARWFGSPVERSTPPRDELAIKLALAVTAPGVDIARVIQAQRTATMQALQDYTRAKQRSSQDDLAWSLVADSLIFSAEAEIRWLDHCETRLARAARTGTTGAPAQAADQDRPTTAELTR